MSPEDPRRIASKDGPETSKESAEALNAKAGEEKVLAIIRSYGVNGCIKTEMDAKYAEMGGNVAVEHPQSRRTTLQYAGKVYAMPPSYNRPSPDTGRKQAIYVAAELINCNPECLDWLKTAWRDIPNDRNVYPGDPPRTPKKRIRVEMPSDLRIRQAIMEAEAEYTSSAGELHYRIAIAALRLIGCDSPDPKEDTDD